MNPQNASDSVRTTVDAKKLCFEFGGNGTFTFLMISDWHRRSGKSDTVREVALFRKAVACFRPALVVFGLQVVQGSPGRFV